MYYMVEITITFSVGAVAGYFFRLCIEDKIIRKRDRDNRYALAYNAFSKAFTPALHLLDDPNQMTHDIIREECPQHEAAIFDFEHMVSGTKNEVRFKEKWSEYKNKCERIKKYTWSDPPITDFPDLIESDGVTVKDFNKELKQLINELLEIARR